MTLLNVKELSKRLSIKPSTIYAWVSQGKIPHVKIHGVIRFIPEDIEGWLQSFRKDRKTVSLPSQNVRGHPDVDDLIARAKQEVYNPRQGETRLIFKPQKGGR